ncbi:hypothetical protein PIB30_083464 [Stylosanthes scabra]|uniref:VQ domain-containing protein n=1 Tax=Stylosanthes scabra TaxID=79078 RepID=A0ABU6TRU7_9FABA|nr:hypothetical protein [Stylosanthes scabra]
MDSPSPRRYYRHHHNNHSSSSPNSNGVHHLGRSEAGNPNPTTFVQADRNNFKHVVQMLTGCHDTAKHHHIPPMKTIPNKKQHHQSGFKLYERRNHLNLNPLLPTPPPNHHHHHHELLSPSILDFPALVLSPVTPLIPDPFARSSSAATPTPLLDKDAEDKAIKDKGYFLHPSPATTPREAQPRLLPLFPTAASPSSP